MLIESSLALCLDDNRQVLNANLNGISQCVIPSNNRDDLEIQFTVSDERERQEDCLVQVTLHFPDLEREDDLTEAEAFHQSILDAGLVKSITGDVIVEFTKEQGDFVAPRGRYSLQLTASYFYMQGAQYAFRIPYDDINSFFLLPKPDGGHEAFVISLNKPIKQGNQRYQHLVLNPHTLEQTVKVNITPEENEQKYEGQLQPEMTMPLHNLIAKLFKVLANKKVITSFLSLNRLSFHHRIMSH